MATITFQASLHRAAAFWEDPRRRTMLRALAASSFVLWCTITIVGRWIAYFQGT
jgi:hypothetical protein